MNIEEIVEQERDFIDAYHEIAKNPWGLILFSIKGSGRHGPNVRVFPSNAGLFILDSSRTKANEEILRQKKRWTNVNISGILFHFFYSWRPVLVEYNKITRIETSTDRLADWLHIEYVTSRNKKVVASLFYYDISHIQSNHMPNYIDVPKSMRQKLINIISDKVRENLTY